MFTGIVRHIGRVVSLTPTPAGQRIVLDPCGWSHHPQPGDSIACSGCCLTLVQPLTASGGLFTFDAIPETLSKTTLGSWTPGRRVNLEAAARAGDRLDGHIVQGHVDATATVDRVDTTDGWRTRIRVPPDLGRYLIPKGSIAVDGVSLTLAAVSPPGDPTPWFEVALIPETLERTTLRDLQPGDAVNIECDATVKTIVQTVEHMQVPTPASSQGVAYPPVMRRGLMWLFGLSIVFFVAPLVWVGLREPLGVPRGFAYRFGALILVAVPFVVIWPLWMLRTRWIRRALLRTGGRLCTHCAYDVSLLAPSGTCPECGSPYDIDRDKPLWEAVGARFGGTAGPSSLATADR